MRHMVVIVPELTGYASIRHVAVSRPMAIPPRRMPHAAQGEVAERRRWLLAQD